MRPMPAYAAFRDFVGLHAAPLRSYRVFPFTLVVARPGRPPASQPA
jgi:hypothetical protein